MAIAVPPPAIPEIAPYLWSATRTADGVTLIGHVPTPSFNSYLAVHAGDAVVDSTDLGLGATSDFVVATTTELDAVLGLAEGAVSFDGECRSATCRDRVLQYGEITGVAG